VPASRTDQVPLAGADGYAQMRDSHREIAADAGLPAGQVERLLGRYGSDTASLIESMKARPELREPLPGAGGYLGAEVVFACTHEGAVRLDDVLSRRTRITIETRDRGAAAAPRAAALLGRSQVGRRTRPLPGADRGGPAGRVDAGRPGGLPGQGCGGADRTSSLTRSRRRPFSTAREGRSSVTGGPA
jgi:glycerol-3-phosphate dehydrogenase